VDVGRSISYVFQDPNWVKKMLIGGLLSLIPIIGALIVAGYWIRIATNVARGYELPLPEWNEFGGDFMRGLKAAVVLFVWALPFILLAACGALPAVLFSNSNGAAQSLSGVFFIGAVGFGFLMWILIAFMSPVIIGRYVMRGSMAAAFQVGLVIADARDNAVALLLVVAMAYALGFAAQFGVILCFIGYIFTSFLAYMMLSHLYGQLWRRLGTSTTYLPENNTGTITAGPGF
jgi:hypothetical protein